MISTLVTLINLLEWIIILLVFVSVILSYFMDPYHPVRRGVDRVVEPMLAPIRRIVPSVGMFDFSPLILIILVQLISSLLGSFLLSLR